MENIKNLSEHELEVLMFRVNMWVAPLSDYQISIMKELRLLAS